jgi:hypothetical protein
MQKQTSINPNAGIGRCSFDLVLNKTFFPMLPDDKSDAFEANFLDFFYFFGGSGTGSGFAG